MSRAELRDAVIASLVIAAMATMVVSIFSLIGQESGEWALIDSLSIGLQAGIFTFVVVLFLTLLRLRHISANPTHKEDKEETRQFLIGLGQNVMMSTPEGLSHSWTPENKIQIIRGVITLNLIGLRPEIAVSMVQSLVDNRPRLGRLRLVIGREDSWESEISTPNIRPAVLQRLKIDAERAQWQIIQSKSTVVLRPTGTPPTRGKSIASVGSLRTNNGSIYVLCIQGFGWNRGEVAGGTFGILMGVLLTALMASHRDRTG